MAATATNVKFGTMLGGYGSIDNIAFDSSYATSGYSVPATIALAKIYGMAQVGINTAGVGYQVSYNAQTGKLQMLWGGGSAAVLAEVTAGTNLATVTATVLSVGY
jgi:hypothetical protein